MRVTVRLFAMLRERAGAGEISVELADGARVQDALAAMSDLVGELPVVLAVNRSYAGLDQVLAPGDELALIPPVSGGDPGDHHAIHAAVGPEPISIDALAGAVGDPRAGAIVLFSGVTREVERLDYEAYREMALPVLGEIAAAARRRHGLCRVAVAHRTGPVALGEASVVVAVSAAHREEAFAGAREVIDEVKARAPIWKREVEGDRATWVSGRVPQ